MTLKDYIDRILAGPPKLPWYLAPIAYTWGTIRGVRRGLRKPLIDLGPGFVWAPQIPMPLITNFIMEDKPCPDPESQP